MTTKCFGSPEARDIALRRLEKRECSKVEIIRLLETKGFNRDQSTAVVDALCEQGLINDDRYARMMIRHQVNRGKGPRYIQQTLKNKGVSITAELITEQCVELDLPTEIDRAIAILERRYPEANRDKKTAQKAYQALLRRGFSHTVIQAAFKTKA